MTKIQIDKLAKGETVKFQVKGNSMVPRIKSGSTVTISPDISKLEKGDVVFCRVHGNNYVHLITAIKNGKYQISNNHGHINGWASKVYGKVISRSEK